MVESGNGERLREQSKEKDVRSSNIIAAKAVADAIRTSLGPRGMDKMIQQGDGEVLISNDGATILTNMQVYHPCAKMLVEISRSQDVEAGDGTTSVVVIAGSLLNSCQDLLEKGIHPTVISDSFGLALEKSLEVLREMSISVDLKDRPGLINCVNTSLSSKVISSNADLLSPIAVDAVMNIIDPAQDFNIDLKNIRVVKHVGGTIDDTELVDGLVFNQSASHAAGGPTSISNAKIALIQFCLSAPKTDIENNVVVSDYAAMDRILREERKYILALCKKIKKSGCNVLLVQKSILRDAVNDLSLHFLAKLGIMVVKDIEREDVEFICKTLACRPVAHVDSLSEDKLGHADLVEESSSGGGRIIKVQGVAKKGHTTSIVARGSNKLVVDEAERSLHDALCVVRSLVKERYLIPGGGAAEIQIAQRLTAWSRSLEGMQSYCVRAFAEALEVIPYTLAENAGLNPINIVTALRKKHAEGIKTAGINVRRGSIDDMVKINVIQPLLVNTSAIRLATEAVRMILKIDDIVATR